MQDLARSPSVRATRELGGVARDVAEKDVRKQLVVVLHVFVSKLSHGGMASCAFDSRRLHL